MNTHVMLTCNTLRSMTRGICPPTAMTKVKAKVRVRRSDPGPGGAAVEKRGLASILGGVLLGKGKLERHLEFSLQELSM